MARRLRRDPLAGLAGIMLVWGCAAAPPSLSDAWLGRMLHADAPHGTAIVRFDVPDATFHKEGRGIQTIPPEAEKVKLIIYDPLGFVVGGIPLSPIPDDNSFTLPGLPAGVPLKFDMRMTDAADVEVAKAVRKDTLAANAEKAVDSTVYMDAPQLLTDTVTVSSGQESSQKVIAVQFRLANGSHYRFTPSVAASDSANVPVACSPTFVVVAGDRTAENLPGETIVANGVIDTAGTGQRFDVKATVTHNCPASAVTITRKLTCEQIATVSVGVQ